MNFVFLVGHSLDLVPEMFFFVDNGSSYLDQKNNIGIKNLLYYDIYFNTKHNKTNGCFILLGRISRQADSSNIRIKRVYWRTSHVA